MSFLNIKIKPLIFVGCSGSGRSAIKFHLTRTMPHKFQRLVSHTTRKPRPNQVANRDFYFVDEKWIKENMDKFVTLTYSGNNNYYGLTSEQVSRVMNKKKIPVFKMTLDAYTKNIEKQHTANPKTLKQLNQINDNSKYCSIVKINKQLDLSNSLHLLRKKDIECNALYITHPSLKELERRLRYSPFSPAQQAQKVQKAKDQYKEVGKYFQRENIIGKYFQHEPSGTEYQEFEDVITRVQSRLFQLY